MDYNQDELVLINNYQQVEPKKLLTLWVSLNNQIIHVLKQQNETSLQIQAKLPNQKKTSLLFLINDYVVHLEHHVNQIIEA